MGCIGMNMKWNTKIYINILILFEYYVGKMKWNEEMKWGVDC